jgi:hypothetical protein
VYNCVGNMDISVVKHTRDTPLWKWQRDKPWLNENENSLPRRVEFERYFKNPCYHTSAK